MWSSLGKCTLQGVLAFEQSAVHLMCVSVEVTCKSV